ncbi:hypothetical protein ILUMI_24189, partial [Ignelater luminosus]
GYRYFDLLKEMMVKLNLLNRADRISGPDESGLQLNTRLKEVVALESNRVVHAVASKEKGEAIIINGCSNADGVYLPS